MGIYIKDFTQQTGPKCVFRTIAQRKMCDVLYEQSLLFYELYYYVFTH